MPERPTRLIHFLIEWKPFKIFPRPKEILWEKLNKEDPV
jgi:hypothetical protein